jgi:hypothetical protein
MHRGLNESPIHNGAAPPCHRRATLGFRPSAQRADLFAINRFALFYVRYYARRLSFAERLLLNLAQPDVIYCSAENEVGKQDYNRQSDNPTIRQSDNQHDVEVKIESRSSAV